MYLKIHRGTNEIGGSCIELQDGDTKILFDLGIPLSAMELKKINIKDYKPNFEGEYNAIFLTHAHPDHYGLLELLSDTPIYATSNTCEMLSKVAPLTNKLITKELNLQIIDKKINIGNFEIIAHEVDHSINGACAYEIKINNKTIVYTGDIRFHGRCEYKNKSFIKSLNKVDYLIMDGTTLTRLDQNKITENNLIKEFEKEFSKDKLPIVILSAQNLDRFVTLYKACKSTKKTLVIDPYTCYILELYCKHNKNIPQITWENGIIKVYCVQNNITTKLAEKNILWRYKDYKISLEEILENKSKYVVKGNFNLNKKIFEKVQKSDLNIIFSMWKGYLDKPNQLNKYKDIIKCIHTSGHAYVKDLQDFIETIKPNCIIPIHTEAKEKYKDLFNAEILVLDDNDTVEL